MKYSILIQWSEEDNAYIASLPEWGKYARTHGSTYQEALDNAQEVLEDLVDIYPAFLTKSAITNPRSLTESQF
ncbi:MAG: type II toxin-antitoxin system HicB family antitoxin [Microcystis wesenbergii Mw_MB_S_20031200_S109]|uniref:Type II toxin-antitoxin system HicB family antitoxin n=2 Tax=Microcystis TaxID=1125 RepID=A0A552LSS1_9CHRO|nr:MAG: type II toxin-antitoxin system HicB family antitoxin [Microcystis wesenbergii Mw_MB_S_20031200_S109]TRV23252.1 MAG: type II toxin-antitoxin system HicB family antitoxin [Microcystis wesenbergii Mw_MB_S_20031200_S109D]